VRDTIIFRPAAEQELREAFEWYEQRRVGLGVQFEEEVDRVLTRVQENPLSFPRVHGPIHRALTRRFPYGLFYLIKPDQIIVVAVFHGRRDPKIWQSRR
jgi:toxin ParE1/3/4